MAGRATRSWMLTGLAILLSGLVAAPAAAQQRAGTTEVRIHLAVETAATSARGAIAANDLARTRVLRVLATTGVAADEVEEIGLALLPEYAPREIVPARTIRGEHPRIAGYLAVRRLSLAARDASHAALVIDLAQGAGASLIAAEVR